MENENKCFANNQFSSQIPVEDHGICDNDLRKGMKIIVKLLCLFPVIVFNMMKLLANVKVGLLRSTKFLPNKNFPQSCSKKYHHLFVWCLNMKINEF